MKNKRKPLIIALSCIAGVVLIALGVWFFWLKDYLSVSNAAPVYVTRVSTILGFDSSSTPRYSGIVEPQQTIKVNKDESKTVSEVLVNVGDEVHVGDVLFRYDTEDIQFSLRQAELDQEGIANQISTLKTQLATLKTEKSKAAKDEQYAYTVEIQSKEYQIEQQEYESSVKKSEIDKLKKSLENTDVLSEAEGVVKEVNTTPKTDSTGQQAPFISILVSGEYRIKGTVSELNLGSLAEGQAVTVHSRVDAEQIWSGTVESIDREPSNDQTSNMYWGGMDSGEKSSKYNFYVVLQSLDGLILGQHVYIEPDLGADAKKDGLWLPAVYVDHDESGSFIWAKDENDKLEKRLVTLGEYDSDTASYEIRTGLEKTDSIAYPSDTLKPGMPTTTDASYQDSYAEGNEGPANGMPGETDPGVYDENSGLYNDTYDGAADGSFEAQPGETDGSIDGNDSLYTGEGTYDIYVEGGSLE